MKGRLVGNKIRRRTSDQVVGDGIIKQTGWCWVFGSGKTRIDAEKDARRLMRQFTSPPIAVYRKRFKRRAGKYGCELVLVRRGIGMSAAGLEQLESLS